MVVPQCQQVVGIQEVFLNEQEKPEDRQADGSGKRMYFLPYCLSNHLNFSTMCIITDNNGIKLETGNNEKSKKAPIFRN